MPDIKRTRKGRPGPKAQRSALIVARGKSSGRDATVQPKRKENQRVKKDTTTVLEAGDSVESFLERAKRETETYETARGLEQSRAVFVDPEAQEVVKPLRAQGDALFRSLPVPRRPAWDEQTSKDQLTEKEEQAFLQWRRGIAATEEAERSRREKESLANSASVATPFERNLEVWRQLWRTLERSDCVLLIVDARWPDLYAPPDLVDYARSLKRGVQVVVNKADYLSPSQREVWRRHFRDRHGLETIFFSARREQAELDEQAKAAAADDTSDATDPAVAAAATTPTADGLASRHDLLNQAEQLARTCRLNRTDDCEGRPLCVGMVGYPNVGKSSCVNVLRNASKDKHGVGARAAVSATPGKTKHLQTLLVRPGLELCDCPGLVFPALVTHGAAELLCAGVVPIARMRDPTAPASLVAARTPRALFDALYGTHLSSSSEPLTANEALEEVCRARDYTCGGSNALDLGRAHVRALDRSDFARLCQLLDLPLETGVQWQSRILALQGRMRQQTELAPLAPPHPAGDAPSGECASSAAAAFEQALAEEKGSSRGGVRCFGRQTVWCTVALLRRVLREASWPEGDRALTSAQAEARLASLAVAAIGGGAVQP